MSKGTIVTFYSYKGGVGRTFALANIAVLLSQWGYKVLCIDWDLEAPGLHLYFNNLLDKEGTGLVELITAYISAYKKKAPNWRNYISEVRITTAQEPLHLISAGKQDEMYIERIQHLNWPELYHKKKLGGFIEQLRNEWKEDYDFILIDSRTGVTDIGGICTVQLPDLLVAMFSANAQSLRGIKFVVDRVKVKHNDFPFDRVKLLVLPVASRYEEQVTFAFAQGWKREFIKVMGPYYAEWAQKPIDMKKLLKFTTVKSNPYWNFGERLPILEAGTINPDDVAYDFENIGALLAHNLSNSRALIEDRKHYIETAKCLSASTDVDLTKDFRTIIKLLKKREVVQAVGIGKTFLDREEYDTAMAVFQFILTKMRRSDPDYYIPLGNLAYVYRNKGDYSKAIQLLQEVREFNEGHTFFVWHALALAYCYYKLGKKKEYKKWLVYAKRDKDYKIKLLEFIELYPDIKADLVA